MVENQLRRRGITDARLLAAFGVVPRHLFVAPQFSAQAYEDHPIGIPEGQTVSQPYIVAAMLQAAELRAADKVLEVGAGSGYQTAILSRLVSRVIGIERHHSLARAAERMLAALGCSNATIVVGDGTRGYANESPFDAIIVSAAAPSVPQPLLDQLEDGGRLVIPVTQAAAPGTALDADPDGDGDHQQLLLVRRRGAEFSTSRLEGCRFVRLIGAHSFKS